MDWRRERVFEEDRARSLGRWMSNVWMRELFDKDIFADFGGMCLILSVFGIFF